MRRASFAAALPLLTLALSLTPTTTYGMPGGAAAHSADKVWGHPLPTTALPVGALTVKAAGRDLMDKRAGVVVRLYRLSQQAKRALVATKRTAVNGRARFDGLVTGQRYQAEIDAEGGRKPSSRVFSAPQGKGVRLLISVLAANAQAHPQPSAGRAKVSPRAAQGATPKTSGAARVERDASLSPQTLRVRVLTADAAKPLANIQLTLRRGKTSKLARTGKDGSVVVAWPTGEGPLTVEVRYEDIGYATAALPPQTLTSQPASRPASQPSSRPASGLSLTFRVFRKSNDLGKLKLVRGTHLLARVGESGVGFLQVLALRNDSRLLLDLGPAGVRIPLPEGALAPQLGQAAKRFARISKDKRAVVITRPIPPGPLSVRVSYDLRSAGGTLDFSQRLPLAVEASVVAITNSPKVDVHGPGVSRRVLDNHGGGKPLSFFDVKALAAGRRLELTLRNLPYRDPTPKLVLIGGALLIMLWAVFASLAAGRGRRQREAKRRDLIDRLAQLDLARQHGELDDESHRAERDPLRLELERLWG
jgi:hypothetical protein